MRGCAASLAYSVRMTRRASILVGLVAVSCTLDPEDNFDAGFGGAPQGTGGTHAGSTGPLPTPDSATGEDDGSSTADETGEQSTGGPGAGTSGPGDETSASSQSSSSGGGDQPTGNGNDCPADALDEGSSGTTLGQPNAVSGSCGGDQAPEQTFEFTATQDGVYTFNTNGSDFDTVLYVLDGQSCAGPELACDDDGGESTQSEVTVALIEGQDVVVVVDGYDAESGSFTLATVSQTAAGCEPSDLAGPLPLTGEGSTSGISQAEGSCGGEEAPEFAFAWTAPAAGMYTIHTTDSDFDTVLYVRDGSCVGEELACDDDGGPSTQSLLTVTLAAGQDIVIFADGYSANSGSIVLTIES